MFCYSTPPQYILASPRVVPSALTVSSMTKQLGNVGSLKRKRDVGDVDTHCPTSEDNPRKAVCRAQAGPRRRKPRGGLRMLPQMPLDIIYEVLSHLGPRELLMLSRSNRDFHTLLAGPSSASFWKGARSNIEGLPERPLWLPEIKYAKLAFDTLCTGCAKKRIYHVEWEILARLCADCKRGLTRLCFLGDLIPSFHGLQWRDRDEMVNHLHNPGKPLVRVLESDIEQLTRDWNEHGAGNTADDRKEFMEMRKRKVKERTEFAQACSRWEKWYKEKGRLDGMLQNLKESGWAEELGTISSTMMNKFLPSGLGRKNCPTVWAKIEKDLQHYVERTRVETLYTRRYAMMCAVMDEHNRAHRGVFPSYPEFATDPAVQKILTDTSTDSNLTETQFRATVVPLIPDIRNRWERLIRSQINSRIRFVTRHAFNREPMDLALGSLMRCSACRLIFEYPSMLSHQCSPGTTNERKPPYLYSLGFLVAFRYAIWDYRFIEIVHHVITACGVDAATVEVGEMDFSGTRLYCTHCAKRMPGVMTVLTWREAVAHCYTAHENENIDFVLEGITWGRVPSKECLKALPLEACASAEAKLDRDASRHWHCGICSALEADSRPIIEAHTLSE
ncbi:hypothetical protein EUX98_g3313 [Antrodiella citrinella]|uniref:F-box domain-containing protein n=1 Tax=Antrodiella citrinella TaxID=2447956 RepID=A0A4S4MWT3_9APHY|nr:hypothetical protein EUX98_g3313 [Antrodiella citrinella]